MIIHSHYLRMDMVMNYYITNKERFIHYIEKEVVLEICYSLTLMDTRNRRHMNISVNGKDNHWSPGLIETNGCLNCR